MVSRVSKTFINAFSGPGITLSLAQGSNSEFHINFKSFMHRDAQELGWIIFALLYFYTFFYNELIVLLEHFSLRILNHIIQELKSESLGPPACSHQARANGHCFRGTSAIRASAAGAGGCSSTTSSLRCFFTGSDFLSFGPSGIILK